jgi:hypothetical protein
MHRRRLVPHAGRRRCCLAVRGGGVEHGGELLGRDDGLVDLEDEPLLELRGLGARARRRQLLPARHPPGPEALRSAGQRDGRRLPGHREHAADVRVPRPRQRAARCRHERAHAHPEPPPRRAPPAAAPGLVAAAGLHQPVVPAPAPVRAHATREACRERLGFHGARWLACLLALATSVSGGGCSGRRGQGFGGTMPAAASSFMVGAVGEVHSVAMGMVMVVASLIVACGVRGARADDTRWNVCLLGLVTTSTHSAPPSFEKKTGTSI